MVEQVRLTFQHPPETWRSFLGVKLDETSYDRLIVDDADVFTPEGALLCSFRRACLDRGAAAAAFPILCEIREISVNRGIANGRAALARLNQPYIKQDGTKSKYMRSLGSVGADANAFGSSAVIGYMDRYPRRPFCRETAFNANRRAEFAQVVPFLRSVDACYRAAAPERYALQRAVVDRTSRDFVIDSTSFTTITVNQNWQTAVHTDAGDLKAGLSAIVVLRAGEFQGAHLVFPHYRVAVKLDTCDLLLFDSHHMHGNTPLVGSPGAFKRVSLVCYYREAMIDCGTAAQELERAKNRKPGDRLKGKLE